MVVTWHHELWTVIPTKMSQVVLIPEIGEISQRRGYVLTLVETTVSNQSSSGTEGTVSINKMMNSIIYDHLKLFRPVI